MKIPCVTMIFHEPEIIKKHLDFLTRLSHRLEIHVIENPSVKTETEIKPYIFSLLDQRKIDAYYLFDQNITNNAFDKILRSNLIPHSSPFILITDGDITTEPGFLDEEIETLSTSPAYAVAVELDTANLPLNSFPYAHDWYPKSGYTGGHLLLMRRNELDHFLSTGEKFLDVNLQKRAGLKEWARTKKHKGRHLTWDLYSDINHPYTKLRLEKSWDETWNHARDCEYKIYKVRS